METISPADLSSQFAQVTLNPAEILSSKEISIEFNNEFISSTIDAIDQKLDDVKSELCTFVMNERNSIIEEVKKTLNVESDYLNLCQGILKIHDNVNNSKDGLNTLLENSIIKKANLEKDRFILSGIIKNLTSLLLAYNTVTEAKESFKKGDYLLCIDHLSKLTEIIQKFDKILSQLDITTILKKEKDGLFTNIQERIQELFVLSVTILHPSTQLKDKSPLDQMGMQVNEIIVDGTSGAKVTLPVIFHCLQRMSLLRTSLKEFFTKFYKFIWKKVIEEGDQEEEGHGIKIEQKQENGIIAFGIHFIPCLNPILKDGAMFENLNLTIDFIFENIFKSDLYSQEILTEIRTFFFEYGWIPLSRYIIKQYCTKRMQNLQSKEEFANIATLLINFEELHVRKGHIHEASELSNYGRNYVVHFAKQKTIQYLKTARNIICSSNYNDVFSGEYEPNSEFLEQYKSTVSLLNSESDEGWDVEVENIIEEDSFPPCIISRRGTQLIDLGLRILDDMSTFPPSCKNLYLNALLDCLDLFVFLFPTYHQNELETIPSLAMIHFNDFKHMRFYLKNIAKALEGMALDSPTHILLFQKSAERFGYLAEVWLNNLLEKQRAVLFDLLSGTNGMQQTMDPVIFSHIEQTLRQVLGDLKQLSKAWKEILPAAVYSNAIGTVVDYILEKIIFDIENLEDIEAKESQTLCDLCKMMLECETFLDKETFPPEHVIKNWAKFHQLMDILVLNLADIMDRFHDGLLKDYQKVELIKLIKALFADTTLRSHHIKVIEESPEK